jgi:hypothetical protein
MDIRYKLFPYPMLSNFTDDYEKSGFISEVKVVRDINELVFYFKSTSDLSIVTLISFLGFSRKALCVTSAVTTLIKSPSFCITSTLIINIQVIQFSITVIKVVEIELV